MRDQAVALLAELTDDDLEGNETLDGIGADSLMILEWLYLIEDELEIKIADSALERIDRTASLNAVVDALLN